MKRILKYIVLIIALLYSGTLAAQEQDSKKLFEKYNWFVSGTLNGEWLLQTTGNTYLGGKIGGGIHLDRFSTIRVNLLTGKNRIDGKEAQQYGIGLDYMITLIGSNGFKPFNLSAIIGGSFNQMNTSELDIKYKNLNAIGGTFAIQASFNINRKLNVFIEPSVSILPKYYNEALRDNMYMQTNLSMGLSYTFKDKYKSSKSLRKENSQSVSNEDVNEIKGKINQLLKDIEVLKEEQEIKKKIRAEKNMIMEPKQKEAVAVEVYFEEFSSFIGQEQAEKIETIGKWMKENSTSIKIVAFSDDVKDKATEENLRQNRIKAIKNLLVDKSQITPERIISATPESLGYENKTGSNAMIVYIPDNQ